MSWLSIAWEIFVNIVEGFLFLYLLFHQLKYDTKKRPYLLGGIVLRIIWITFLNFVVLNTTMCLILLLLFDIIYCNLMFNDNGGKKLMWGCSYIIIALLANRLTFWFADIFTDYKFRDLVISGKIRIIMSLVYLLTCTILVTALSHWRKKDLFLPVRFRIILFLLVCLGIVASDQLLYIIISTNITDYNSEFINRLELISYIVLLVIFGFIAFIEYLGIVTQQNETLRNEAVLNKLNKEHFETINTTISALRSWKHDYKTHLQVILNLSKNGENQELEEYVLGLETTLVNTTHLISTNNQTLDALLSAKILEFQQYSINFTYEVYLTKALPFDDISFTSLIGNLLDNALEACRNMDYNLGKYINFSIKPFHDMIYINVENSTTNRYIYHPDGTLKTTKKGVGHGIGLKRVKDIVSSIHGFCNIYPETDKFTVVIMLPLPESSKGTTDGD